MSLPAMIFIGLVGWALGINLAQNGQTKTINFWHTLIGAVIEVGLLYWGGFFSMR